MLRLLLLRHAKSSWEEADRSDHERPLNARGREAADMMGQTMQARGLLPERILCSTALRTRETFARLLPFFRHEFVVRFLDDLYEGGEEDYLRLLQCHGESASPLLLIGHNPSIAACALSLMDPRQENVQAMEIASKFPTGTLVVIDFSIMYWTELKGKTGKLVSFMRPRDLEKKTEIDEA